MENCIFCKIIAGDIPSTTVYEDEDAKVICDISPAAPGHLLVLPKEHASDLTALSDEALARVSLIVKKMVIAVKKGLGADGVNVVQNNGEAAGQTVKHVHIHIIPRFEKDGVHVLWDPTDPGADVIKAAAEKISAAL